MTTGWTLNAMRRVFVDPGAPQRDAIEEAAKWILRGGVVAIPTDTLYGLAANPFSADAVARVFAVKGRAAERALPLSRPTRAVAARLGPLSRDAAAAGGALLAGSADAAGGGAARRRAGRVAAARAKSASACRPMPWRARSARRRGRPLTATSANVSGEPATADPAEVERTLGDADRSADRRRADAGRRAVDDRRCDR